MRLVQTHLTQITGSGTNHLIAWLPADRRLRPGVEVKLEKNPRDRWRVDAMYSVTDSGDIEQRWGLSLPRSLRTER